MPQIASLADLIREIVQVCSALKKEVAEALKSQEVAFQKAREAFSTVESDSEFTDAFAQTVTFAFLLARGETDEPLASVEDAVKALGDRHSVMAQVLQGILDSGVLRHLPAIGQLLAVLAAIPPAILQATGDSDPWQHFYEDFLAKYDKATRYKRGVYYTPRVVVDCQVRLLDELLRTRFGLSGGFADSRVVVVDPAMGTGNYLLSVIDKAAETANTEELQALASRLFGYEIMASPYAVADLRLSKRLEYYGIKAKLPLYLANTLKLPETTQPLLDAVAATEGGILVCLGNPPYRILSRVENADKTRYFITAPLKGGRSLLRDLFEFTPKDHNLVCQKHLRNLYVYFWRWALWQAFERHPACKTGVISFVTSSAWLSGQPFAGMRELVRQLCDEIWVIDIEGGSFVEDGENIFDTRTPVCIVTAARHSADKDPSQPATLHYCKVTGKSRQEKLAALAAIKSLAASTSIRLAGPSYFRPRSSSAYGVLPALSTLFGGCRAGIKLGRTWPVDPDPDVLLKRWEALAAASNKIEMIGGCDSQKLAEKVVKKDYLGLGIPPGKLIDLKPGDPPPPIIRFAYRAFDRQFILADARIVKSQRAAVWQFRPDREDGGLAFVAAPYAIRVSPEYPLLYAATAPVDHDCRFGWGSTRVIVIRHAAGPWSARPSALSAISHAFGQAVTAEDFVCYTYGALAHTGAYRAHAEDLAADVLRCAVTKDRELFFKIAAIGRELIWLHTFGERFVPPGQPRGQVPAGKARVVKPIPTEQERYPNAYRYDADSKTLFVGEGEISPVEPELWKYAHGPLRIVRSWLDYRMARPKVRWGSPLNDITVSSIKGWPQAFTEELLQVLWILERTLELDPIQDALYKQVLAGPVFTAEELGVGEQANTTAVVFPDISVQLELPFEV